MNRYHRCHKLHACRSRCVNSSTSSPSSTRAPSPEPRRYCACVAARSVPPGPGARGRTGWPAAGAPAPEGPPDTSRPDLPSARPGEPRPRRADQQRGAKGLGGRDRRAAHRHAVSRSASVCSPGHCGFWRQQYPELQAHLVEFRHTQGPHRRDGGGGRGCRRRSDTSRIGMGPAREIGVEEFLIVASGRVRLPDRPSGWRFADLADRDWVHFTAQSGLSAILESKPASPPASGRGSRCGPSGPVSVEPGHRRARDRAGTRQMSSRPSSPGSCCVQYRASSGPLSVYTRVRPDPITAAFVAAIADETLVMPPHVLERL